MYKIFSPQSARQSERNVPDMARTTTPTTTPMTTPMTTATTTPTTTPSEGRARARYAYALAPFVLKYSIF